MTAEKQEALDGMPAQMIEVAVTGTVFVNPDYHPDGVEVNDELKIKGQVIVRKVGMKHTTGGETTPFATAQIDTAKLYE